MSESYVCRHRVLAIYPFHLGFGFAVMESGGRLVDSGLERVSGMKGAEFISRVETVIATYRPNVVAVEDGENARRGERAIRRVDQVVGLAHLWEIQPILVSRGDLRRSLRVSDDATKHDIAVQLAELFPELRPHLPPKRLLWKSEDGRMKTFEAVGLAMSALSAA